MPSVITATRDLLEAAVHLRRDKALRAFEAAARKSIGKVFARQGASVLRALPKFAGYFAAIPATEAYDPGQPRDEKGMWTASGSFAPSAKIVQAARDYQTNPGDDRARAFLTAQAHKTIKGGENESLHPGEITVYRAGGVGKKGLSFTKSKAEANRQLFLGQTKITQLTLKRTDPAIDINKLLPGSRFSGEREVFVDTRSIDRSRFAIAREASLIAEATPKAKTPPPPIDGEWDVIADDTASEFTKALVKLSGSALVAGAKVLSDDLGIALRFDLKNPRAEAFMREHGADLVTKINETTREDLKALLSEAIDNGWSYTQTAKAIRDEFDGFSKERAKTVAVTESAFAYEGGQRQMAAALQDAGLEMEKSWIAEDTACDICADNADRDWVPEDEDFEGSDGDIDGPPGHVNCRCASLTRRAKPEDQEE